MVVPNNTLAAVHWENLNHWLNDGTSKRRVKKAGNMDSELLFDAGVQPTLEEGLQGLIARQYMEQLLHILSCYEALKAFL